MVGMDLDNKGGAQFFVGQAVLLVGLFLLVLASYANSLFSPFVLDDIAVFVDLPEVYLGDFSFHSLQQMTGSRFGVARFIPLLTIAVDHHLMQGSIVQYHLTNIAIHLLTSCAVFFFFKTLLCTSGAKRVAPAVDPTLFCWAIAMLWALHPVQTNAVTYLVQRMASLAALFYMAALAFYLHARLSSSRPKSLLAYVGFALSAICALLSKENSATLPVAVALIELLFIAPEQWAGRFRRLRWWHWLVLAVLVFLFLPLAEKPLRDFAAGHAIRHYTMGERLLTEGRIVVFYLSLLILPLPSRMNLDHDFSVSHGLWAPPSTMLSLLTLLGLMALAAYLRKNSPFVAFGIAFFFLNLAIESTVVPLELIFEHRLYLPSVGFSLVLVTLLDLVWGKARNGDNRYAAKGFFLATVILSVALSLLTTFRNHDWRDSLAIYEDCYLKSPNKPRALVNYGVALGQNGEYEKSIRMLERAIEVGSGNNEDYVKAANNILVALIEQKNYEEAVRRGQELFRDMPRDGNMVGIDSFMANLGMAYFLTGDYIASYEAYKVGMRIMANAPVFFGRIIGVLEAAKGDAQINKALLGEAAEAEAADIPLHMAKMALEFREYSYAATFLRVARENIGDHDLLLTQEALYKSDLAKNDEAAQQSGESKSRLTGGGRFLLAACLKTSSFIFERYSPARIFGDWLVAFADTLEPNNPDVIVAKFRVAQRLGGKQEARQTIEHGLVLHPDNIALLEVASDFYLATGQNSEAVTAYRRILEIYPNHPRWRNFERMIRQIEESNSE